MPVALLAAGSLALMMPIAWAYLLTGDSFSAAVDSWHGGCRAKPNIAKADHQGD